eukprot:11357723-Ditylum_brightwellii.AAC.1
MQQGQDESLDSYMQRFNGNIQTLELVGRTHIICSPELMEIAGSDPTDAEKKTEEEKFKAMLLLKRLDPVCYNDLVEELCRSVTVGRDEYPETTPTMYDLIMRRSGTFDSQGQGNRPDRGSQGCGRGGPGKQGHVQD